MPNMIDTMLAEKAKLTPDTGYNVVGVDGMSPPGEALYLVEHFDDHKEAEAARAAHEKNSGDTTWVYAADTGEKK